MKTITDNNINRVKKILVTNRIRLLELLLEKDTCVCEMVKVSNLKHNLISHHLKVLVEMNFISNSKNGQHVIYSLNKDKRQTVLEILDIIKNI